MCRSSSPGPPGVKAKKKLQCRVPGCSRPACQKAYLARRRICSYHTNVRRLQLEHDGPFVRWCQQCRRFQPVEDFDQERKSCRKVLAIHNSRRYKREASHATDEGASSSRASCHEPSHTHAPLAGAARLQSTGSVDIGSALHNPSVPSNCDQPRQPLLRTGSVPDTPRANDTGFAAAFHAGAVAAALREGALRVHAAAAGGLPPNPFAASCFAAASNSGGSCIHVPPTPSALLGRPALGLAQQWSQMVQEQVLSDGQPGEKEAICGASLKAFNSLDYLGLELPADFFGGA